jgi:predicted Ser/Thr protein kinase
MSAEDPIVGKPFGNCRIVKKLGAGGMGTVYLAEHSGLNKSVAVKILPKEMAAQPEFIERFLREARLAARLEHPNVVQVFDVGEQQGVYYITMQYVEGRSLDAILKERKKLSLNEALTIAKRVAVALAAAHRLGIVHRDIKPANILISKEGVVKVADFGLAKDEDANRSVSGTGQIMGTPYYMSPEQAQGQKVDARSDLYSLGATLYHLATGQRAFQGETPLSIVVKHVSAPVVPPREIDPSIPEAVSLMILKLLAKSPADRHASAEDLIRDLDAVKAAPPAASRPQARRTAMIALPVAALVAVGIGLGALLASGSRPPAPTPPPPAAAAPAPPVPVAPPAPAPADPRQRVLSKLGDPLERKQAEEVLERFEGFMQAMQKKDYKAISGYLDRLSLGDLSEEHIKETVGKAVRDGKVVEWDLEQWELEDLELKMRAPLRPPTAIVKVRLTVKNPKNQATMTLPASEVPWTRRLDGKWYLTRLPRNAEK